MPAGKLRPPRLGTRVNRSAPRAAAGSRSPLARSPWAAANSYHARSPLPRLRSLGCDWIDCSSGGLMKNQAIPVGPGYQVPFAERIRKDAGIITIAIGLITEARQAENIVAEGKADMVSLARGFLWDPRWAWHAAQELGATPRIPDRK